MKKKLIKFTKLFLAFIMIFSQLSTVTKVLAEEVVSSEEMSQLETSDNSKEELMQTNIEDSVETVSALENGENNDDETIEEPPITDTVKDELVKKLNNLFVFDNESVVFNAKDLKEENVVIGTKELYDALKDTGIIVKLNGELVEEPTEEPTEEVLLKNDDVLEFTKDDSSVTYTVMVMGDITDDSIFADEDITTTMEGYLNEKNMPTMDLYTEEDKPFGTISFEDIMLINGCKNKKYQLEEEQTNLEVELVLEKNEYYTDDEFEVNVIIKKPVVEEPVEEEKPTEEQDDTQVSPVLEQQDESTVDGIETNGEELPEEEIKDYINGIMGTIELSDNFELVDIKFNDKFLNATKENNFVAAGSELNEDEVVMTIVIRAVKEGNNSEIKISGSTAKELGIKEYNDSENINIIRKISSNNYLKDLGATLGNFDTVFDKYNNVYTLTVPAGTEEVTLVGSLEDLYASVTGFTTYKLTDDKTVANIVVTAEDGSVRNYFVYIIREAKTEPIVYYYSINNYLKLLEIKGYSIDFDKNTLEYKIDVTDVSSLDITAIAEDSRARVVITGNESFKEGENVVTISVTAENGQTRDYKVIVNKVLKSGLEEIKDNSNTTEKVIIIILIVLVVLGLLYLIFKKDEEETTVVNNNGHNEKEISPDKSKNVSNNKNNSKNIDNKKTTNNKVKKGK